MIPLRDYPSMYSRVLFSADMLRNHARLEQKTKDSQPYNKVIALLSPQQSTIKYSIRPYGDAGKDLACFW